MGKVSGEQQCEENKGNRKHTNYDKWEFWCITFKMECHFLYWWLEGYLGDVQPLEGLQPGIWEEDELEEEGYEQYC